MFMLFLIYEQAQARENTKIAQIVVFIENVDRLVIMLSYIEYHMCIAGSFANEQGIVFRP